MDGEFIESDSFSVRVQTQYKTINGAVGYQPVTYRFVFKLFCTTLYKCSSKWLRNTIEYESGEFQCASNIIKPGFWIRNVQPNGFNTTVNRAIHILLLIVNKNDGFK